MSYATPSSPQPPAEPVTVVGPLFTVANPVELIIKSTSFRFLDRGSFMVTDLNGNEMLKVKGPSVFSFHDRRVMLDNTSNPIATLRPKTISAHRRWKVYKGKSTDDKDLLYTAKLSSIFHCKTKIVVFLTGNTSEKVPDFTIKANWTERSFTIYLANTKTIIAQADKEQSFKTFIQGKTVYAVKVNPNIDFAFIVSLVVAKHEITPRRGGNGDGGGGGGGGGCGGG